jgi:inorganic triphosphatase YgiF
VARALEARAADPGVAGRAALVSTYFDTSDHALARQGLTLRVRERDGHFVQTVKSAGRTGTAGLARGEWEDAIASAQPDPQAPETGGFVGPDIAGRLIPLFRTEIVRRTIELSPSPGTRIEAAIDRGRVYAPARDAGEPISEPISEVELESKSGPQSALYDVALDLIAVAPLRLEQRSKAERGYRLAATEAIPAAAVHAVTVDLDPGLCGDDALRRIGTACLAQILQNEAAVLAGVAEGIHQMRVAVRRLRAVLAAFGRLLPPGQRRRVSRQLRWLADALGPARNLDVFETALLVPARNALAEPGIIAALTAAVERRRKAAYAEAAKAIRSTRYTALMLRQLRWFEGCFWREGAASHDLQQPIGDLAARILDRRRRIAKRRSKGFGRQSAQQRHKLRIALKQLRYASEVLAGLYDGDGVRRFTTRLKQLQDDLGEANDVRVGRDIVAELATPKSAAEAIADAGKSVLDWHEQRLARREPKLRQHLDRLLAAEPFWRR